MNKRIMKIVDVLLKQDSYITIDKISEELAVSNKTIRNDLQIVDQYLEENNLKLIKKTASVSVLTVKSGTSCTYWKVYGRKIKRLPIIPHRHVKFLSGCS